MDILDLFQYYDAQNTLVHLELLQLQPTRVQPAVEIGQLRFIRIQISPLDNQYLSLLQSSQKFGKVIPSSLHSFMPTRTSWFGNNRENHIGTMFHDITVPAFGRRPICKFALWTRKSSKITKKLSSHLNLSTLGRQGSHIYSILSALLIRKMLTLWSQWEVLKTLLFSVASNSVFDLSSSRTIFPSKRSVAHQHH